MTISTTIVLQQVRMILGWYNFSGVLDDYSRYIITRELFISMSAAVVQELLDQATLQILKISRLFMLNMVKIACHFRHS